MEQFRKEPNANPNMGTPTGIPNQAASTVYLDVEPIAAPQAPAPVPSSVQSVPFPAPPMPAQESVPEWDQYIPPPAIAQAVPDVSVDGAAFRADQYRGHNAPLQGHATGPTVGNPAMGNYGPSSGAPAHSFANFHHQQPAYQQPAPPARSVAPAGYSPFRDDRNSYHTVIEYQGVAYYARELDDATRAHITGFGRRFIADPAHQIVEVTHSVVQPRPIALAEVLGGELEWYGEKINLPAGYIYEKFPQLQGYLNIRPLELDELANVRLLTEENPALFAKYLEAQERMYSEVITATLTGWSLPVEMNLFNVHRLTLEVKRALFIRIGASSEFGVSQDDWFHRRDNGNSQRR